MTNLTPIFGPQAGGTIITIIGSEFIVPVEQVYIGGSRGYVCEVLNSRYIHPQYFIQSILPLIKLVLIYVQCEHLTEYYTCIVNILQ